MATKSAGNKRSATAKRSSSARKTARPTKASPKKSSAGKSKAKRNGKPVRKWSAKVTKHSNALDLEENIFESHDPKKNCSIA